MYTIADYGAMMGDPARMRAYEQTLKQVVKPGSVVVDIGAGMGTLALLACRLGAKRVHAIEPADVIEVAREIAAANGFADRIEFHQRMSTDVTLPELADVVIVDLVGMLPWYQHHIPSIVDARRRLLAPGGTVLPASDTVWAAVVEAEDAYQRHTRPWQDNPFGLEMSAARQLLVNTWARKRVSPQQLLAGPLRWAIVDYAVVQDPNMRATLTWTIERRGVGHFLAAGFDRTVGPGAQYCNAPDSPDHLRATQIHVPVLFPFAQPVALEAGDVVTAQLSATLVGDEYVWAWETQARGGADGAERAGFRQSTFFALPLSPTHLRKHSTDAVAVPSETGRIALLVLTAMNDGTPLGAIASRVQAAYPGRFARFDDALTHVAALSQQFS